MVESELESSPYDSASLGRAGGIAALIVVAMTVAEVVAFTVSPPPESVLGWFELLLERPAAGIVGFWGLELPMYAGFILVFVAFHSHFRPRPAATVAVALVLVGSAVFFATNNPFTMLTLSRRFAAATADSERAAAVAAGEAVLALTNQRAVGGFNIGLFLVTVAGLLVSAAMLRDHRFGRGTALVGFVAHGLSLADNIRQVLTSSVLTSLAVIIPAAIMVSVWFAMVGVRLLRLGSNRSASTG